MKTSGVFLMMLLLVSGGVVSAQNNPCAAEAQSQMDFWVGDWQLSWPGPQTGLPEDSLGRGRNHIARVLGGCIVQENFENLQSGYAGKSWSTYSAPRGTWQQTWVDNQGGYLVFTGGMEGAEMILKTAPVNRDGKTIVNRMVFRDIAANSFKWHWQRSEDGGKTWTDRWVIRYERAEPLSEKG